MSPEEKRKFFFTASPVLKLATQKAEELQAPLGSLTSAQATLEQKHNPISMRNRAMDPTIEQSLAQCQNQLEETTALHQQCLALGPLTQLPVQR